MRRNTNVLTIVVSVLVAAGVLALPSIGASAARVASRPSGDHAGPAGKAQGVTWRLQDDAGMRRAGPHDQRATRDERGRVAVTVDADDPDTVANEIRRMGGKVDRVRDGAVDALVPAPRLDEVAELAGVATVREQVGLLQPTVVSEGVLAPGDVAGATGATAWHTATIPITGAGVDVAIVDLGFAGYDSAIVDGELPPATVTQSFCASGTFDNLEHGTEVAKIVHDMAPGASLHLVCIDSVLDLAAVRDYLRDNDINIANASFGSNALGRGDGAWEPSAREFTNTIIPEVEASRREDGVLWTVAAGNEGQGHYSWRGTDTRSDHKVLYQRFYDLLLPEFAPHAWTGSTGDGFVEFANNDDNLILQVPFDAAVGIDVKWDDWTSTTHDHDVFVTSLDMQTVYPALSSSIEQSEPGHDPIETTAGLRVLEAGTYRIFVSRWYRDDRPTQKFDLFVSAPPGVTIERTTAAGSISEPGTWPSVQTVGAHCYATGVVEPYSGRGLTIDSRRKPDISGPDGTSSTEYGPANSCDLDNPSGFLGTSAAAPHVAGAAALFLEHTPGLDVAELQTLLESRTRPAGPTGRDSAYGAGLLDLGDPAAPLAPAVGELFSALAAPVRVLNTRSSTGGHQRPFVAGEDFVFDVTGVAGVPDDATAVAFTVTASSPTSTGTLLVYPTGTSRPPTSASIAYVAGRSTSNHVTSGVGSDGKLRIFTTGATHVVVDVVGFYGPTGTDGLHTITPVRAVDTRPAPTCIGPKCTKLGAGATHVVPRPASLPAEATAAVLNVTALRPSASGFFTLWNGDLPRPNVSSLAYGANSITRGLVITDLDGTADGFSIYSSALTDVVVDVVGYYAAGSGSRYVPLAPVRTLDTRAGNGRPVWRSALATGTFRMPATLLNGVPSDATAVLYNTTVTGPTASGSLTVYASPGSSSLPTLNYASGQTIGNAVITPVGGAGCGLGYDVFTEGCVGVGNSTAGRTHVIADLFGYFVG